MGVDKLGNGNKDYAKGYAAGFSAGVAVATGDVRHKLSSSGSNVVESATDSHNLTTESSLHSKLTETDVKLLHRGSHAMERNKLHVESECLASVTDEDLNLAYPRSNALGSLKDVATPGREGDHTQAVTEEDLGHVAPGCFVRVGSGDASYWVEIGQIEGVTISGIVHPELSTSLCVINHDSCEIARFSRDQITALGCDRYCWC